jgi:hypothetical protein
MSKGPIELPPRRESFDLEEQDVGEASGACWSFHPPCSFKLEDVVLTRPDVNLDIFSVVLHNTMLGRWSKHVPLCSSNERIVVTVGHIRPPFPPGKTPLRTGVTLTGTLYEKK